MSKQIIDPETRIDLIQLKEFVQQFCVGLILSSEESDELMKMVVASSAAMRLATEIQNIGGLLPEHVQPIGDLSQDLMDLSEDRRKADWLRTKSKPGRPALPIGATIDRAYAALAVDFYVRAGLNHKDAYIRVGKGLGVKPAKIKGERENIREGELAKSEIAQDIYWSKVNEAQEDYMASADAIVQMLNSRQAKKHFPK